MDGKHSKKVVATATSHELAVTVSAPTEDASILVDDISVVEDAWDEEVPAGTAAQASATDGVVRSQSGRILQNTLTDGATVETSSYSYDAAGRLVSAVIPRHILSYAFASTGGCVSNPSAGMNGNRTSLTLVSLKSQLPWLVIPSRAPTAPLATVESDWEFYGRETAKATVGAAVMFALSAGIAAAWVDAAAFCAVSLGVGCVPAAVGAVALTVVFVGIDISVTARSITEWTGGIRYREP